MAHINLLPWREALRKRQQQEFLAAIVTSLVLVSAVMVYVHIYIGEQIDYQKRRNDRLAAEISALDKKLEEIKDLEARKNRLVGKMEVIQQLQTSRPEAVHLFDQLARTIPEGVALTDLTQDGKALSLKGLAQSNARVSTYMRNLDASPWLENPLLVVIEAKEKKNQNGSEEQSNRFELRVQQTSLAPIAPAPPAKDKGGKAK